MLKKILAKRFHEEDVVHENIEHLIWHRLPWLTLGLLGGLVAVFLVSKFEAILSTDVRLAFFIPMIVYLSDAVGTQTETIYVRALSKGKKIVFWKYILKESAVGLNIGLLSGLILGVIATVWLGSALIGTTVFLTMLVNLTFAPILAVFIPGLLSSRHADPALGSGPVATIIQDVLSLAVYFAIASLLIL